MEKRYHWKLQNRELVLGERTLIMGVLNVTPDSFSDGGAYADPDRAFARALELEDEGADIIDIGAESTKPGSQRISEAEELRRLVPVLKRLRGKLNVPISVDTYKSGVAEKALEHGAEIINDPTGVLLDLQLPKVITKYDAGLIINHMRGTPETWAKLGPMKELMRSIVIDLEAALHRVRQGRVEKHQLVIDPGLGFGKRREQNSEIIAQLGVLKVFDLPIAIGPSRKSFLRKEQPQETEFATAGAVAACILGGAHIVRVHDVKNMKIVAEVADTVRQSVKTEEEQPTAARPERERGQTLEGPPRPPLGERRPPPLRSRERPPREGPPQGFWQRGQK
ncbi:MAG: dihydropteroate synthase [Acidobacteriaceae bacterium]|nr:dihydropteroate synthase [Acidobacteriaceae bacterium]MBV9035276.1 dihydropteroate synthase [Acidobacteriaceae bacterium]